MTFTQRIKGFLRQLDAPGAPVNLFYKRKRNFSTSFGGAMTLFAKLGILSFFLSLANNIV